MFLPIRFKTSLQLGPHELETDFDTTIISKLQKSLEGVCSRYGYIKPNSIEILRRSAGMFVKQHFNGYIRFDMICKAEVCNPGNGMIVEAVVKNKNALGVLAESSIDVDGKMTPVLDIIIPRKAAGVTSEIDLDSLQNNDSIYVAVLGKRYQLNDSKISVIGKAVLQPGTTQDTQSAIEEVDDKEREQHEEYEEEIEDEDGKSVDDDTEAAALPRPNTDFELYLDNGLVEESEHEEAEASDAEYSDDDGSTGGYYEDD